MRLGNQSQALHQSASWDLDLLINIIDPWIETDTVCQTQGGKKAQGHTRLIDPKWPWTTRMTPLAEVRFVTAVTAGGSVNFLPAV